MCPPRYPLEFFKEYKQILKLQDMGESTPRMWKNVKKGTLRRLSYCWNWQLKELAHADLAKKIFLAWIFNVLGKTIGYPISALAFLKYTNLWLTMVVSK